MTTTNHEALWDAVGEPAPQASALTAIALCLHELVLTAVSDHQVNLRIAGTLEAIEERLEEIGDVIGAVDRNLSDLGAEVAGVTQAIGNAPPQDDYTMVLGEISDAIGKLAPR